MIDIKVRSALIRVRWNDIPVRRDESSTETTSGLDLEVTLAMIEFRELHQRALTLLREPPGRHTLDNPSKYEVGNHGEQDRHHQRLPRVEAIKHLELIDDVHADAEQHHAGRRNGTFAQAPGG